MDLPLNDSVVITNFKIHENHLGILGHINSLILSKYKRLYYLFHPKTTSVRAWQGHINEAKCFVPIKGSFLVCWVKIDDFKNPSKKLIADSTVLNSNDKKIIEIPKGYANGLKALEPNSELMVFSEFCLEDSLKDKVRFDHKLWFNWEDYD